MTADRSRSERLHAALDVAIRQIGEVMGEPYGVEPRLTVWADDAFWALAEPDGGAGLHIQVSTGVADRITDLWRQALDQGAVLLREGKPLATNADALSHVSVIWLMLHEISHFDLGHFAINGGAGIVEHSKARFIASRADVKPAPIDALDPAHRLHVDPCLELQADHDAIELLLEAYSSGEWEVLRIRSACIFAVMILIEAEENEGDRSGTRFTHPRAATRIFQLFGHLSELWSIPARLKAQAEGRAELSDDDLPSADEIDAYQRLVILPAFADALALARAGNAARVVDALGDPADFFADIDRASRGTALTEDDFQTEGSREWFRLQPVNQRILALMGETGLSVPAATP